jgi:hypothetical protein
MEARSAYGRELERQEEIKREEERQRKREDAILDYSAKVVGGFIEVKMGEDVVAMEDAWMIHLQKRNEALNDPNISEEEVEAMGLKNYTWEEWQRYYRKMHGMPEDGIKRIPFNAKEKKERVIDWSARYPLSVDELVKYGVNVSKTGPVMIPLENAMRAASDLLKGAQTIYTVRDGLEVMRRGLETETNTLKKRREKRTGVQVIQANQEVSTQKQKITYSDAS